MAINNQQDNLQAERLFKALAEQLKTPLIQISHHAELGGSEAISDIGATASRALHLIDTYLLSTRQQELPLEPVSISSVLYDVAQLLDPLARQHNSEVEIQVAGKYGPVMAHRESLEAGLVTLGQSLLEADNSTQPRLVLSLYKGQQGLITGVFGDHVELTPQVFRRALKLFGGARQPLPNSSALNGAGLYVANSLFDGMNVKLRVAHHRKLTGLAAGFLPSAQLQLV